MPRMVELTTFRHWLYF